MVPALDFDGDGQITDADLKNVDINTPWKTETQSKEAMAKTKKFYVYSLWIMWIVQILFMNILLLNFLIASISQSYENVTGSFESKYMSSKIEFNNLAYVIKDIIDKFNWNY